MRSTVTLEPDVAKQVHDLMRERGTGFKETINELLRRGLSTRSVATVDYEIPVFHSSIRPGIDLDRALAVAEALEDDEILRKISVGK